MNSCDEQNNNSDNKDFLRLLMANQNRIYAFILTLVPNWSDADDIMQEAAETMWSKFQQSQPINNFSAWGIKIA
jgi:RNA polymerase sigma-70 factor (ECF subfamily)